MQTLFDHYDPLPAQTLLEELETIDKALLEGDATPEQERRGQELVDLCNSAEELKSHLERLTKELESERGYRMFIEKELRKKQRRDFAYKDIDDLYTRLKADAESDAQAPFDEHFRQCLWGLQAILKAPNACTCNTFGWHGEGHDIRCPLSIAAAAIKSARVEHGEALKTRHPQHYKGHANSRSPIDPPPAGDGA